MSSMWRNKWFWAFILCILCLTGCAKEQTETETVTVPKVSTNYELTTVTEGTFRKTERAVGSFAYLQTESVTCEYEDALLKEQVVKLGATVKKGDVLAVIVQQTDDTELARLEIAYKRAVTNMENGISRYYSRIAAISGSDNIAYMRRVQAENDLALYKIAAQKQVDAALEELEEYRQREEEKYITAPFDGRISWTQTLRLGEAISKGSALFVIYDPASIYARIPDPSEAFLLATSPGSPVTVSYMQKQYEGTVISTPNDIRDVDGSSVYIACEELDDPDVSSLSVECTVLELKNMLLLDRDAIRTDDTADYVMVQDGDSVLKCYVICGPENGDVVCILDGLAAGQQVVLN